MSFIKLTYFLKCHFEDYKSTFIYLFIITVYLFQYINILNII